MNAQPQPVRRRSLPPVSPRRFIEDRTDVRVRFNEVDALHIVWHGHYINYFEEGRRAFGRRLGIDYPVFIEQRTAVPVIHLAVDFLAPARLPDTLTVTTRLLQSDSARLDFCYEIHREGGGPLLATGVTSQVFTTPAGELILNWPPFMVERLKAWESLWKRP